MMVNQFVLIHQLYLTRIIYHIIFITIIMTFLKRTIEDLQILLKMIIFSEKESFYHVKNQLILGQMRIHYILAINVTMFSTKKNMMGIITWIIIIMITMIILIIMDLIILFIMSYIMKTFFYTKI